MSDDLTVRDIVNSNLVTCAPATPIAEAAANMQKAGCGSVLVMDGDRMVGIWTEHDALSLDLDDPRVVETPVGQVMSSPVRTVGPEITVSETGRRMKAENLRHLAVVDAQGALLGMVSQTDVVRHFGVEHYLLMRDVKSALPRTVLAVSESLSFQAAIRQMHEKRVDAAVVRNAQNVPDGIITERDLVRRIALRNTEGTVRDVASRPLHTISENTPLLHARDLLDARGFRHLGVIGQGGALIGLLSMSDILTSLEIEYVRRLEEALRQRDQALQDSRRHLLLAHRVIEASLDGIIITDAQGYIEAVNPAFTRVTGYTPAEVIGRKPSLLSSGRHDATFYRSLWDSLNANGHWQGEIWNRRKNGVVFPEWLTITRIDNEGDPGAVKYAGIFSDITERKRTEERIRNLAYFDVLTGLPNRRLFNDRLAVAINMARRHQQHLAVMFLDLDLFKRINDSLGHSVGDQVLVEMAARLKACVRDSDTVARMGGDEFTILQAEIEGAEDSARLARRIIESVTQPFLIEGRELYLTTSIGISVYPEDGDQTEVLVKNADTAMYRAKDLGRNSYQLYTPAMNAQSFERLAMEGALRKAIERQEFRLNYQVKINLQTGQIGGAEALIRWHHPDLGLVSPADFIPLAEDTGLIVPIGDWVLKAACAQNAAWQRQGLPSIRIAVNISPHQFRQPDLVGKVRAILNETGLVPRYLELEVTETVLMEHMDIAAHMLNELRELGVHTSIDDFGTGYSSLAYLKRIPIDSLKIDASFMRDVATDEGDAEIVSAIIALAHNLRLNVVAEGVETKEQIAFLQERGCDEIQGFLVSRPLTAENFSSLFAQDLFGASLRPAPMKRG
ncbi:MAG: EAL domain-containing protein [Rhodospirillales bacterium]|nr:EAL domain-containing protein [Rhodospirillales bacterium]